MWAVIGGSAFDQLKGVKKIAELPRETPFGLASSIFNKIEVEGEPCLFLARHGADHTHLPSEINYRANIYALKRAGATKLISFSTVGNLQRDIKPKEIVFPSQFINYTKRVDRITFAGNGLVGHVALSKPIWQEAVDYIAQSAKELNVTIHTKKTYICIEGPTFSTQAESKLYHTMGADVIGMTAFPEYALAREAGICYLNCCFCTDNDSWDDNLEHVTLEQIIEMKKHNSTLALNILKLLLNSPLKAKREIRESHLAANLFTKKEHLNEEKREILAVIEA